MGHPEIQRRVVTAIGTERQNKKGAGGGALFGLALLQMHIAGMSSPEGELG
jgi:hypothetical protein